MSRRAWTIALAVIALPCALAYYEILNFEQRHWWADGPPPSVRANQVAGAGGGSWRDVSVTARDGAVLRAWLFRPDHPNGKVVILMHEFMRTRLQMLAQIPWLMRAGYTCLAPDERGHGSSGGTVVTFGIEERYDVIAWTDWLTRNDPDAKAIYGLGNSLGAAALIQGAVAGAPIKAIVADSTEIDFSMPYAHLAELLHIPQVVARGVGWVIIEPALWNARARYGLNLRESSMIESMREIRVPVLLIQGEADPFIPPLYGGRLLAANPRWSKLWVVPGAHHAKAWQVAGSEYQSRVLEWFGSR